MANSVNNIKAAGIIIAKAAAQTLKDNMKFCSTIDKADETDFEGKNGYKAGDSISVTVPARYASGTSFDLTSSIQDSVEQKKTLQLDTIGSIGMAFGTAELATDIGLKSVMNRFVVPAAQSIAQTVESTFLQKATQATFNTVGTAGSTTYTVADILAAGTKLDRDLAPMNDRTLHLNSAAMAAAIDARKGLFNNQNEIGKQYRDGVMGSADGFDWMKNELGYTHTNGTASVTAGLINGSMTEGTTTLTIDTLTGAATIKKGSVFTIANVFKVHPITKASTGVLQQFVVTADATMSAGAGSISISPAIYASNTGASNGLKNVDALPADNAALTFVGAASTAYAQSLAYHPSAFRMASVPLVMPKNAELAEQVTVDGITVAVITDWDQLQRRMITRLDFLGGLVAVRPEWSCRVTA